MIHLFVAALSTASAAPPPVVAPDDARIHQRMERLEQAMDAIGATDVQRQTVHELLSEGIPHLKALHEEAHALREELRAAFLADKINREAIGGLRLEMVDLFDRATETGFDLWMDVAEVFAEQRAELAEIRAKRVAERAGEHAAAFGR